jgi:membrane peptidoglycan carboxypeptidase
MPAFRAQLRFRERDQFSMDPYRETVAAASTITQQIVKQPLRQHWIAPT